MARPEELKITDNIRLLSPTGGEVDFFTITAIDDVFYRDLRSAIDAGATQAFAEVTNLNPTRSNLIWIGKIEIDGNVTVQLKQPAPTNRWGTTRSPLGGYLLDIHSPFGGSLNGRKIDVWIAQDYPPSVELINNTNVSITPVLWWVGKRFLISKIAKPSLYTTVRIGGIGE